MSTGDFRSQIARREIKSLGGPTALAARLSTFLGKEVSVETVSKWRVNGVPPLWGVVIEQACGVNRAIFNPELYKGYKQGYPQVTNRGTC